MRRRVDVRPCVGGKTKPRDFCIACRYLLALELRVAGIDRHSWIERDGHIVNFHSVAFVVGRINSCINLLLQCRRETFNLDVKESADNGCGCFLF